MRLFFLIVFLLVFSGCKDQKDEVISIDEILPKSKKYDGFQNEVSEQEAPKLSLSFDPIEVDSVIWLDNRIFPERFGVDSVQKYRLFQKESYSDYYELIFEDSLKTMNAFFNWLDCFGQDCKAFSVGDTRNFQRESMQIWVNDTAIVYVSSSQKGVDPLWMTYLKNKGFELDWNYYLVQSYQASTNWYTYQNGIKSKINK